MQSTYQTDKTITISGRIENILFRSFLIFFMDTGGDPRARRQFYVHKGTGTVGFGRFPFVDGTHGPFVQADFKSAFGAGKFVYLYNVVNINKRGVRRIPLKKRVPRGGHILIPNKKIGKCDGLSLGAKTLQPTVA